MKYRVRRKTPEALVERPKTHGKAKMAKTDRLKIKNFAQVAEADLSFGDLTVLVGAQGTGKSLALQWLKVAMDGRQIVTALHDAGHPTDKPQVLGAR